MNTLASKRIRLLLSFILLFSCLCHAEDAVLTVGGEVKTPIKFTLTDLKALPATTVRAKEHDGTTADYEGVLIRTVLERAGVPQGESLRGEALQLCVLAKAADGYKVVFSLAELDSAFTDKQVLLAYRRNGTELDAKAGPLRLVIPDEKRPARWVRQVRELEIIRVQGGTKR